MPHRENLFKEFPPTTKNEWLNKIKQDLGGRSLTDLQWHLSESIHIDPIFHPDDQVEAAGPLNRTNTRQNSWEIGEYVSISESLTDANQQALTALSGGAEALLFLCGDRKFKHSDLVVLLQDIKLDTISIHFECPTEETFKMNFSVLQHLADWRGSIYSSLSSIDPDPEVSTTIDQNSRVKTRIVDGRKHYRDTPHTTDDLAEMLLEAHPVFCRAAERKATHSVNQQLKLLLTVDASYFVSIAKIRALKILWANFIKAFGVHPYDLPEIEVHLAPYPVDSDPYTNMIRAATQALSAAIGGADRIFVAPTIHESSELARRIARNVQHLLKMESYIDRVIDPAAGSYYLEKLTGFFVEEAWDKFRKGIGQSS